MRLLFCLFFEIEGKFGSHKAIYAFLNKQKPYAEVKSNHRSHLGHVGSLRTAKHFICILMSFSASIH